MLCKDVKIGGRYIAKVSDKLTTIRVTGIFTYNTRTANRGGWVAINEATGRTIKFKTAIKFLQPANPEILR